MFFPFGLNGTIRLKGLTDPASLIVPTLEKIETKLEDASATWTNIEGTTVHFEAGIFRVVWNWNILVPFGSGHITVKAKADTLIVRYQLSTVQMFATVMTMLTFLAIVSWNGLQGFQKTMVPVLIGGWLWLFGMNYLIAAIRFPLWLRRGLRPISSS